MAVLFAVIAPSLLIFADLISPAENTLPACCRRDGKHHCAMMAAAPEPLPDTQIKAEAPVCPFRSQASITAFALAYLPAASATHFAGLESHPAIHEQTHAALRVSETRSHQKRGPPASVLS
jgi:hypothetical protein